MEKYDLYKDIQARTGGEIYVGVVGPVRTGKSTFIRRFMEEMILPEMPAAEKNRTTDELPASASGKTVTTVEPKFIPREAVKIAVSDGTFMKIRMVDCVGFPVEGAEGTEEDGHPRMVHTPWNKEPVSFQDAAETGTRKVIRDHATLGLVITTDGSFGEIPRSAFVDAEKETIDELQNLGKPFLIVVNTADENGKAARETKEWILTHYHCGCIVMNCSTMRKPEFHRIFGEFLLEFPVTRIVFRIPKWIETLDNRHWLKQELFSSAKELMKNTKYVRGLYEKEAPVKGKHISASKLEQVDLSSGKASVQVEMEQQLYYQILSEMTGTDIGSEYQLIAMLKDLSARKREFDTVSAAIEEVRQKGYGIIRPTRDEITIEDPVLIRQGNRYGVKIKTTSPSIHLIRAEIDTELSPIVGSEAQANDLIQYIRENTSSEEGAWGTLIFGKSMEQMVEEGIQTKLAVVSEETQQKLQRTIRRIVNAQGGHFICIIM